MQFGFVELQENLLVVFGKIESPYPDFFFSGLQRGGHHVVVGPDKLPSSSVFPVKVVQFPVKTLEPSMGCRLEPVPVDVDVIEIYFPPFTFRAPLVIHNYAAHKGSQHCSGLQPHGPEGVQDAVFIMVAQDTEELGSGGEGLREVFIIEVINFTNIRPPMDDIFTYLEKC